MCITPKERIDFGGPPSSFPCNQLSAVKRFSLTIYRNFDMKLSMFWKICILNGSFTLNCDNSRLKRKTLELLISGYI